MLLFFARRIYAILLTFALLASAAYATTFGAVQGIIHDPQHRPVQGAGVLLRAKNSDWNKSATSDDSGVFRFDAVPAGEYMVTVGKPGFNDSMLHVEVTSDVKPVLHFQLAIADTYETVAVSDQSENVPTDSSTTTTLISRIDVAQTPGADRTNSLAIITDYVPGSYVTHDQLHTSGGHQVSWLVDGVPVPNTSIASNVGPQFDPKDIDYLEAQRGSYDAGYGDRTYGVFNVVPRTGFERDRQGELTSSYGNFYQTNDQVNFGGHSQSFAYYASLNGNRSNLGLQTPGSRIIHDAENGYGGFGSFIFNVNPSNQLRLLTSLRRDYYQIPESADGQHEADMLLNFSWVRTFHHGALLTVSPFYHHNTANYDGATTKDNRSSDYRGGQATLDASLLKNEVQIGYTGFGQHDTELFAVVPALSPHREQPDGSVQAVFLQDKVKITSWLMLSGGVRQTHYSGAAGFTTNTGVVNPSVVENVTSPRVGASVRIPRLNWVFRAFYGQFYQPPPLVTASGPLLQFVNDNNLGFLALRGERDEEHQFGLAIPFHGWIIDADTFRNKVRNFFDHSSVSNSNIFFPLTIDGARIRGWELTLRSPKLWNCGHIHLAYSNQIAEGEGAITGGLTDFSPPSGFFILDHDQRNTLNVGGTVALPKRAFAATNIYYGSGFANGDDTIPHPYLPGHTTFDLTLGKEIRENVSLSISALNVANRHLLLDNSTTFGGTHFNNPREVYVQLKYRFHL